MSQKIVVTSLIAMTMIRYVMHLLRTLMTRSNEWSNDNKEAVHIRAPGCNALVVAYKYEDSLAIKVVSSYKRKRKKNQKVHTKILPKANPKSISL